MPAFKHGTCHLLSLLLLSPCHCVLTGLPAGWYASLLLSAFSLLLPSFLPLNGHCCIENKLLLPSLCLHPSCHCSSPFCFSCCEHVCCVFMRAYISVLFCLRSSTCAYTQNPLSVLWEEMGRRRRWHWHLWATVLRCTTHHTRLQGRNR